MDERLISINAAIKTAHFPVIDDAGYEVVRMDDILALPTVDAVPVVRCKDCKSFSHGYCRFHDAKFVRPDGYCYWGERKDGKRNGNETD